MWEENERRFEGNLMIFNLLTLKIEYTSNYTYKLYDIKLSLFY